MYTHKSVQIVFSALIALSMSSTAQAGLVFVNESDGTHDQAFYIDSGDASTDFIDLEFGATIDAKLRYEIANDQFTLNRDLDLLDNEMQNALLENLAAAPTCDGTVIGKIYYNTTDSNSYVCNGTTFEQIDGGAGGHTQNTDTGTDAEAFTLDNDDDGTNIDLNFGTTGAQIRYETVADQLAVNKDVDLAGNEVQDIRMESLAAAPATCDGTQAGRIYFNTVDSVTYACNGTSWSQLENTASATVEFPVVQARRTTTLTLVDSTYIDVTLDATDLENDAATLEHDNTDTDRINIGATAMYQIIYGYTAGGTATATHEARARVRVNDTTVLSGSESVNRNFQNEFSTTSASFLARLDAGDFITLQLFRDGTADATQDEIYFSVVKLEGIKGDPGADGLQGLPGSVGLGTNEETFTLDLDDTGGDIGLVFGTALGESLTWDDTNSRFDLSDDLRVAGELVLDSTLLAGGLAGTSGQVLTSQGAGSAPAWTTPFEPSVFYAYDGAGAQTITATEATLNIDTPVITDANYALAGDQVTITDAGLYKMTVDFTMNGANTSGGQRSSVDVRLQEGGVDIPGALIDCYLRETEENSCSMTILEDVAAGGVIRVRVDKTGGTAVTQTLADGSRLMIEKIR